ncbi:MAG TPA: GGDEF domain-containing protein [Ramlibacter sp.]|uniref:GGDEF domain-containing protein n=1 Tax=Ramlibacter sp. TaxID=1917967 RepID=UPI002B840CA6|nr:GGDEF domain-containing protein [Ramlibacter sp.]HVZ46332.1 GGDEF domain-containing protein [Ramlibacter sp.]
MTPQPLSEPDDLVALGIFAGAQVLVVLFSVIKANAYRERAYLFHAAAVMMAVLAVQNLAGKQRLFPQAVLLAVMALAGMQLRDLIAHAGGLRQARRWLVGVSLGLMPALALASILEEWVLPFGALAWGAVVWIVLQQAWRQSRPWVWWVLPGMASLVAAALVRGAFVLGDAGEGTLPVGGLLTLWAASIYLATDWRGRLFGETRARIDARNTVDPLTGLAMPLMLHERIRAAATMMRRYGHPSVIMMIHIEGLARLAQEFGPEASEAALLAAAERVRECVRDGDVAARLTHSRMAVLAEGLSPAEGAANVASRILVAGLREPVPSLPAEFLRFRIVLAPVPVEDISPKALLHRLGARLDQELQSPTERRIVTVSNEEVTTQV